MALTPPNTPGLEDPVAETIRRIHAQKIGELQQLLMAGVIVLPDNTIENNNSATIAHKLGREPKMVWVSPVRGIDGAVGTPTVGQVSEVRGAFNGMPIDRTKVIVLLASNFGASVLVDVVVF